MGLADDGREDVAVPPSDHRAGVRPQGLNRAPLVRSQRTRSMDMSCRPCRLLRVRDRNPKGQDAEGGLVTRPSLAA
jgi:hypothetical protein